MGSCSCSDSDKGKTVESKGSATRRKRRGRGGHTRKDSAGDCCQGKGIVAAEDLHKYSFDDLQVIAQWKDALDTDNTGLAEIWLEDNKELDLANFVFSEGSKQMSSLQYAIEYKKEACAKYLIESGKCQLDWRRPADGRAALHFAVLSDNPDLVRLLLAKKATVNLKDDSDDSPADLARERKYYDVLVILKPKFRIPGSVGVCDDLDDLYEMVADGGELLDEGTAHIEMTAARTPSLTATAGHCAAKQRPARVDDLGHGSHLEASADHFDKASAADIAASRALLKELQAFVVPKTDSSNPFNRRMAKKSIDKAKSRLQTVALERSKLPKLEGWIEKKSPSAPYSFQKRWVVVRDGHMLWNPKQKFLYDATNGAERESWAGQLYLFFLKRVEPVASKSNNKLKVFGTDSKKKKDRQFLWRAADKEQRDFWLRGLRRHHKYLKDMIVFLDMDQ